MPYPCLKISFGVGQMLEHIRALSATSCRDLPFARSWETHGAVASSTPLVFLDFYRMAGSHVVALVTVPPLSFHFVLILRLGALHPSTSFS